MFGNSRKIFPKIAKRLNQWLPEKFRRQVSVQVTYDRNFFEDEASYRYFTDKQIDAFAEEITVRLQPHTAIDLGCGMGMYLLALRNRGVKVIGFDASLYAAQNVNPEVPIFVADLTRPFRSNQQWDVAICFEVAEHLPYSRTSILVETLCSLSNIILFTAAGPNQPGIDHLTLQPKSFWDRLYQQNGFLLEKKLTQQFLDFLNSIEAPDWFCNNFSIYVNPKSYKQDC